MQRRELFRLLGASVAIPALTPDLFAMFQAAQPKSGYALRTLNEHQNATVVAMTDMILPATATPGAKAVRVNEFIDLILTEWARPDERSNFLDGLADVDKRSNELFAKNFVDGDALHQEELLRDLDQRRAIEHERLELHVRDHEHDSQLQGNFFGVLKRMTLYGYYTSEVGFTQELHDQIIPGSYHGCTPVTGATKA